MAKDDVQIIKPPMNLKKAKVGKGPASFDYRAIERAEQAIDKFGDDINKWGLDDITEIDKALAKARREPDKQEEHIAHIFRRAMDLKGQGGSFGYDLITQIGDTLKRFTKNQQSASDRDVDIIAAHIDALRTVLTQNIRGDGGEVGQQIVAGLLKLTSGK